MKEKRADICNAKPEQTHILSDSIHGWSAKNERERTLLRKEINKYIKTCEAAGMARPAELSDASATSQKPGLSNKKSGSHSLASLHHFKSFR
jgi:hypothetical protein